MFLDTQHRFIAYEELFRGTADTTNVCVRRVMSRVVQSRAKAIIAAHNHPSGAAVPSRADIGITDKLRRSLLMIDVRLVDHVIIGATVFSFASSGLIDTPWLATRAAA